LETIIEVDLLNFCVINLFIINSCRSCDFSKNHNHASLRASFCFPHVKLLKMCAWNYTSPQATRDTGSSRMQASRTASETWSQSLSAEYFYIWKNKVGTKIYEVYLGDPHSRIPKKIGRYLTCLEIYKNDKMYFSGPESKDNVNDLKLKVVPLRSQFKK